MWTAAWRRPRRRPWRAFPLLGGDDEADRGGQAAADVKGGEGAGPVDLGVTGLAGDLAAGVVQHPHAGGTHRVAAADQAAAGVDRDGAVTREFAVLHGLPA